MYIVEEEKNNQLNGLMGGGYSEAFTRLVVSNSTKMADGSYKYTLPDGTTGTYTEYPCAKKVTQKPRRASTKTRAKTSVKGTSIKGVRPPKSTGGKKGLSKLDNPICPTCYNITIDAKIVEIKTPPKQKMASPIDPGGDSGDNDWEYPDLEVKYDTDYNPNIDIPGGGDNGGGEKDPPTGREDVPNDTPSYWMEYAGGGSSPDELSPMCKCQDTQNSNDYLRYLLTKDEQIKYFGREVSNAETPLQWEGQINDKIVYLSKSEESEILKNSPHQPKNGNVKYGYDHVIYKTADSRWVAFEMLNDFEFENIVVNQQKITPNFFPLNWKNENDKVRVIIIGSNDVSGHGKIYSWTIKGDKQWILSQNPDNYPEMLYSYESDFNPKVNPTRTTFLPKVYNSSTELWEEYNENLLNQFYYRSPLNSCLQTICINLFAGDDGSVIPVKLSTGVVLNQDEARLLNMGAVSFCGQTCGHLGIDPLVYSEINIAYELMVLEKGADFSYPPGNYVVDVEGTLYYEQFPGVYCWLEKDFDEPQPDPKPNPKCPPVKCYTETTDKKLYLNSYKISDNDIPFVVRQKTTKCTPKDTVPKQKYYCEENEIDEKLFRLLQK